MLPKILWLQTHVDSPERIDQFVTAAELVQASLGVRPQMDLATASTTMLLDITTRQWSEEILAAAQIPGERLPGLIAPGEVIATIPAEVVPRAALARLHARGRRARPASVRTWGGTAGAGPSHRFARHRGVHHHALRSSGAAS